MAQWHYNIDSNERIKLYNRTKVDTYDYLICDVTSITENKKHIYNKKYYQHGKDNNILNIFLSIVLILIFIVYIIFYSIDNSVNVIGIILPLTTNEFIAKFLNPFFQLGKFGNKIYLLVVSTFLSILASGLLYSFNIGVPSTFLLSMIGIILTWVFS